MLTGIDVSNWQGPNVDFHAVASSGRRFAFCKATEGVAWTDPTFSRNWAEIKAAGLVRGAYAFARPEYGDRPEDEADHFLSVVGALQPGDLLALDLETGSGNLESFAQRWLDHVAAAVGFRPLLYSYLNFVETRYLTFQGLSDSGLWLAAYQATMPAAPGGWPFVAFWQHSSSASVPGVAGNVDESFFNGDEVALLKYGKPGGTPAPQPTPAPAPQPAPVADAGVYVVRSGDTLSGIASAHGVSLAALEAANPQITNPNLIFPGQVVHLPTHSSPPPPQPAPVGRTYVVRSGDSMWAIAQRLGVSLLSLERANPQVANPNVIFPGEVLHIP